MPKLDPAEIKSCISRELFYGITLDTSVIYRYHYNLEHIVLCALDQFKEGIFDVLISEIIAREVKCHIAQNAEESQRTLERAIRKHTIRWKLKIDIKSLTDKLALSANSKNIAHQQFAKFEKAVSAKIVPMACTHDSMEQLLELYFTSKPPFKDKKDKKHEFPDALALLSLERLAKERERFILCVSADHGWREFCDASNHLVYVDDLVDALSYFNFSDRIIADLVIERLRAETDKKLIQEIGDRLSSSIDLLYFYPEGNSQFPFLGNIELSNVEEIDFLSITDPTIIKTDKKQVTFTTRIDLRVQFHASFHFYVRDSFDRDNVSLGSQLCSKEETVKATLVITAMNEKGHDSKIDDVEFSDNTPLIDFGDIEPISGDDPTR